MGWRETKLVLMSWPVGVSLGVGKGKGGGKGGANVGKSRSRLGEGHRRWKG